MKKVLLSMGVISLLLVSLLGCTTAAPVESSVEFADPYVPIAIRQADGTTSNTQQSAYVRKHEVLVPLAIVLDHLKQNYQVEADNTGLNFSIATPSFEMETPLLTEFLKEGVDFRLGATSVYGAPYVNLKGLEKLLNISLERSSDGQTLVIHKQANLAGGKAGNGSKLHSLRKPFTPKGKISLVWDHFLGDFSRL